jgi:hypothetical protein
MQKENNQLQAVRKVYEIYWDSYLLGDAEAFATTLDDTFEMIGTSETEVCHTKTDGIRFLKAQIQEVVGKVEMRNRQIDVAPVDALMLVNEQCDIYVWIEQNWNFYSKLRISTLLKETEEGWKVVQQHGSLPDMRVQEGETLAIDKISRENVELHDAIKRATTELEHKNRELQIEAALERVRARAMAMQNSSELSELVARVFEELVGLDFSLTRAYIYIIDPDSLSLEAWTFNTEIGGIPESFHIQYLDLPYYKAMIEAWKVQEKKMVYELSGEEKKETDRVLFSETAYKNLPEAVKKGMASVDKVFLSFSFNHFGAIQTGGLEPLSDEKLEIFNRFGNVFDLTYTRFNDLKQAEAQAREAKIEAALEKVRSRSLAMHSTSELGEVVTVIVEKLTELGVVLDANGVVLCTYFADSKDVLHWIVSPDFKMAGSYLLPWFDHPIFREAWESKESGDAYFSKAYSVEDKNSFFEYAFEYSDYRYFPEDFKQWVFQNDKHILSFAWQKNSAILIPSHTGVVPSADDVAILKRFAKVFEQTYTRFLDLQKAEAQAREAQIEAAVERVRAKSMGMYQTSDLYKVNEEVLNQLYKLKVDGLTGVSIYLVDECDIVTIWDLSSPGNMSIPNSYSIKYDAKIYPIMGEWVEIWKTSNQDYFVFDFPKVKLLKAIEEFKEIHPEMANNFRNAMESGKLKHQWSPAGRLSDGLLSIDLMTPPSEDTKSIVLKMAGAFNMAYQRFLDLQKAEAQAREAQIQLALERVRARTMAMQNSEELSEVSYLLNKQVVELGIPTRGCAFNIYNEHDSTEWFSNLEGTIPAYKTPRENIFLNYYEAGQRGETLLIEEFGGERIKEHYRYLATLSVSGKKDETIHEGVAVVPEYQIDHVAYFKYGYLLFITLGSAQQAHEVFKRFAKEFEQTYTRFLDLKQAEAQAREAQIENALEKVRSRTMAMQHSDELTDVASLLFNQVSALGIKTWSAGFNVWIEDNNSYVDYLSLNGEFYEPNTVQTEKAEALRDVSNARKSGVEFAVLYVEGEKIKQLYLALSGIDEKQYEIMLKDGLIPSHEYEHFVFGSKVSVMFITYEPVPEAHDIFKRFGNVFEQTYTRFLDLQKAEAQAREAQIQLSLERIRAKAMSMQHSDELSGFLTVLFEQFAVLNLSPVNCHLSFFDLDNNRSTFRLTGKNGSTLIATQEIDLNASPVWNQKVEDLKSGHPKEVDSIYIPYENISEIGEIFKEILEKLPEGECPLPEDYPNGEYITEGYCKYGYLGYSASRPPSDEEKEITRRIANEFGNVYQRFLDLQKAEAQARENHRALCKGI